MKHTTGGCLCGAVSFEITGACEKLFLCSCAQCRKITGSAFASNMFVSIADFAWRTGEAGIVSYTVPGRDISKAFCGVCGSGVPWASTDATKMIIPAGSLDTSVHVAQRFRIFASEEPAWAAGLHEVPTYDRFPGAQQGAGTTLPKQNTSASGTEKT